VQGLRCGADDYVPKPFKRAELAARIRAHIRARDAFQQQQVGWGWMCCVGASCRRPSSVHSDGAGSMIGCSLTVPMSA
jgi:DNA-binding response OmpR family regulator